MRKLAPNLFHSRCRAEQFTEGVAYDIHADAGRCNQLFQGKLMAKDIREHLKMHMTYGHTPTPYMLLSANAALCSDCESIVVPTKKGFMRKHGPCGPSASPLKSSGSIGPHSQKAPPSKRKRLADNGLEAGKAKNSQSQQQAGDAYEDEDETDRENEAGGMAAALQEKTEDDQNKPQDEAGMSDAEA